MIQRLAISGVHFALDDDIRKYVESKIGKLDRYVSRHTRESLHVEVKLKASKAKNKQTFTCEVIVHLPQESITASETAVSIFAAVDLVEEKLKKLLHKYKERHHDPKLHRRLLARLDRRPLHQ